LPVLLIEKKVNLVYVERMNFSRLILHPPTAIVTNVNGHHWITCWTVLIAIDIEAMIVFGKHGNKLGGTPLKPA
jgi:hypothetical protein